MIDYAYPTMKAEKALSMLHDYALMKNYREAMVQAQQAILAASQAYAALLVMEQKENERAKAN